MQLRTTPRPESRTPVAVLAVHGELRTLAAQDIAAGEVVMELEGVRVALPTRFTIQVGLLQHLELPADIAWTEELERYPWRFLNHSCMPNTRVVQRGGVPCLLALEDVSAGTELDFDYEANELELAEPFTCRCGHCDGHRVRGFQHLGPEQRAARAASLSDHLRPLLAQRA